MDSFEWLQEASRKEASRLPDACSASWGWGQTEEQGRSYGREAAPTLGEYRTRVCCHEGSTLCSGEVGVRVCVPLKQWKQHSKNLVCSFMLQPRVACIKRDYSCIHWCQVWLKQIGYIRFQCPLFSLAGRVEGLLGGRAGLQVVTQQIRSSRSVMEEIEQAALAA